MCSESMTKWGLVLINIAFFLGGGAILGAGIWLHVDDDSYTTILKNVTPFASGLSLIKTASLVFILVGAISFVPALFGCCGACLKIRLFLILYVIILAVFLLAELGFVVALIVQTDKVTEFVRGQANDSLSIYKEGLRLNTSLTTPTVVLPNSAVELAWDTVHIQLECCGIDGPGNFLYEAPKFDTAYSLGPFIFSAKVPLSCCTLEDKSKFPSSPSDIKFKFDKDVRSCLERFEKTVTNQAGCESALMTWVNSQFTNIIIAGVVVILVEIIGIVCGIKLFRTISGDNEKV